MTKNWVQDHFINGLPCNVIKGFRVPSYGFDNGKLNCLQSFSSVFRLRYINIMRRYVRPLGNKRGLLLDYPNGIIKNKFTLLIMDEMFFTVPNQI